VATLLLLSFSDIFLKIYFIKHSTFFFKFSLRIF
jgi:hypothetical protein